MVKEEKTNFPDVRPIFTSFCTKLPKFGGKFVWLLHFLFGPFRFAAEQSASWH
jgi:hypothetical protein